MICSYSCCQTDSHPARSLITLVLHLWRLICVFHRLFVFQPFWIFVTNFPVSSMELHWTSSSWTAHGFSEIVSAIYILNDSWPGTDDSLWEVWPTSAHTDMKIYVSAYALVGCIPHSPQFICIEQMKWTKHFKKWFWRSENGSLLTLTKHATVTRRPKSNHFSF